MAERVSCIFSINTGRSGSEYLSTIFRHVKRSKAYHEPDPVGYGEAMRQFAKGHHAPMKEIAREKAEKIADLTRDGDTYVETNHCFIKGFGWFLPEQLLEDRIGVIVLTRKKARIARSYLRMGGSPLVPLGRDWVMTPDKKEPLVRPPSYLLSPQLTYFLARSLKYTIRKTNSRTKKYLQREIQSPSWLNSYEIKCLEWYVDETNALAEEYKQRFPAIKFYEVDISGLNNLLEVQKMLDYFGLQGKDSLKDVVGTPTNLKLAVS